MHERLIVLGRNRCVLLADHITAITAAMQQATKRSQHTADVQRTSSCDVSEKSITLLAASCVLLLFVWLAETSVCNYTELYGVTSQFDCAFCSQPCEKTNCNNTKIISSCNSRRRNFTTFWGPPESFIIWTCFFVSHVFLAYFPYFEKMEVGLWNFRAVCLSVCLSPSPTFNSFWMLEPICMKLGMCIMVTGPILTAYFINSSYQLVCLYVCPISLLGNGSGGTLLPQGIHLQQ
jgi:hypothetical protein